MSLWLDSSFISPRMTPSRAKHSPTRTHATWECKHNVPGDMPSTCSQQGNSAAVMELRLTYHNKESTLLSVPGFWRCAPLPRRALQSWIQWSRRASQKGEVLYGLEVQTRLCEALWRAYDGLPHGAARTRMIFAVSAPKQRRPPPTWSPVRRGGFLSAEANRTHHLHKIGSS